MPGVARPVRMPAKSSLATSTAFSIFSSASRRVSSIMVMLLVGRRSGGRRRDVVGVPGGGLGTSPRGDQRSDLLTTQRPHDVALPLHAEDDHGQLVVHAQAEGGGVDDAQAALEGLVVRDLVVLAGVRVGAGV